MSETTDPNRLGPVTREWVAALERRIEELEAKYERLETIASMQPEPQHSDVRVGTAANDLSDESPATVAQQAVEGLQELVDVVERGEAIGAHFKLTERSPESAAAYWREQWEKQHAELVALRAQLADIPERGGVGRYEEMSQRLQVAEQRAALQSHGYRVLNDKYSNAMVEIDSLRAQLAARPVVTATDEQIDAMLEALFFNGQSTRHKMMQGWLSTLGVVQTKQVEAWVAGDRVPHKGEIYVSPGTVNPLYEARSDFPAEAKARVLVRKTINVVQEPTNGQ